MIKHLWMSAVCFLASPLLAMTINNVEIEFPPSNYEWKLLVDNKILEDMFDMPLFGESKDSVGPFHMFTHREGDALEIFAVQFFTDSDIANDEMKNLAGAQHDLDEELNCLFPNHRWIVNAVTADGQPGEWTWNDGNHDLMYGLVRVIAFFDGKTTQKAVLSYATTAVKNEYNRFVWNGVLDRAHFVD